MEKSKIDWWIEWRSWALPLRVGMWADHCDLEVQLGPFGFTWIRSR